MLIIMFGNGLCPSLPRRFLLIIFLTYSLVLVSQAEPRTFVENTESERRTAGKNSSPGGDPSDRTRERSSQENVRDKSVESDRLSRETILDGSPSGPHEPKPHPPAFWETLGLSEFTEVLSAFPVLNQLAIEVISGIVPEDDSRSMTRSSLILLLRRMSAIYQDCYAVLERRHDPDFAFPSASLRAMIEDHTGLKIVRECNSIRSCCAAINIDLSQKAATEDEEHSFIARDGIYKVKSSKVTFIKSSEPKRRACTKYIPYSFDYAYAIDVEQGCAFYPTNTGVLQSSHHELFNVESSPLSTSRSICIRGHSFWVSKFSIWYVGNHCRTPTSIPKTDDCISGDVPVDVNLLGCVANNLSPGDNSVSYFVYQYLNLAISAFCLMFLWILNSTRYGQGTNNPRVGNKKDASNNKESKKPPPLTLAISAYLTLLLVGFAMIHFCVSGQIIPTPQLVISVLTSFFHLSAAVWFVEPQISDSMFYYGTKLFSETVFIICLTLSSQIGCITPVSLGFLIGIIRLFFLNPTQLKPNSYLKMLNILGCYEVVIYATNTLHATVVVNWWNQIDDPFMSFLPLLRALLFRKKIFIFPDEAPIREVSQALAQLVITFPRFASFGFLINNAWSAPILFYTFNTGFTWVVVSLFLYRTPKQNPLGSPLRLFLRAPSIVWEFFFPRNIRDPQELLELAILVSYFSYQIGLIATTALLLLIVAAGCFLQFREPPRTIDYQQKSIRVPLEVVNDLVRQVIRITNADGSFGAGYFLSNSRIATINHVMENAKTGDKFSVSFPPEKGDLPTSTEIEIKATQAHLVPQLNDGILFVDFDPFSPLYLGQQLQTRTLKPICLCEFEIQDAFDLVILTPKGTNKNGDPVGRHFFKVDGEDLVLDPSGFISIKNGYTSEPGDSGAPTFLINSSGEVFGPGFHVGACCKANYSVFPVRECRRCSSQKQLTLSHRG
eukprot:GHVN01052899.1.p1 GENE.GHVN01052899.1~~GHVN01052899.1.p1  ORF type:complete len:950 (+),score=6.76 GHVN01052899.1:57-2906(+)